MSLPTLFVVLLIAILVDIKWFLIVVLIHRFMIAYSVGTLLMLIVYLYISFGEMPIQICCLVLN